MQFVANIVGALTGNVQLQGGHIRVPDNTLITFQLQQPLRVVPWGDEGYYQNGYHYHHEGDYGWYR